MGRSLPAELFRLLSQSDKDTLYTFLYRALPHRKPVPHRPASAHAKDRQHQMDAHSARQVRKLRSHHIDSN